MFSLSHAPVALMPLPAILLSTLPLPLNAQPRPIKAPCLLSAGASPPVCLLFAGCLSRRMLSRASALRHLLSRSHLTYQSSTPLLRLRQLVVASHLFAPPMPLNVPPTHNWLCRRRHRCPGVGAVDAQVSLLSP
jgi:hypothetical protein